MDRKRRTPLYKDLIHIIILIIVIVLILSPTFFIVLASFKHRVDIFSETPFSPFQPTFDNYLNLVKKDILRILSNSLMIAVSNMALSVVLGSLAAYSFSRFKMRGDNMLFFDMLTFRMGPPIAFILPIYILFTEIGLRGSILAVTLSHLIFNLPLAMWIMRGFFDEIPRDVEECALVDGCSRIGSFLRMTVPLAAPGLAVTAILCYMFSWNEFLFAMILTKEETTPITVLAAATQTPAGTHWGELAAIGVLSMLPMLILVAIIQKYITRGLTFGAVKG